MKSQTLTPGVTSIREQIQHDLITLLDTTINQPTMNKVCEIIVTNFRPLTSQSTTNAITTLDKAPFDYFTPREDHSQQDAWDYIKNLLL